MTVISQLFTALFLAVLVGCGGAVAPEPSGDASPQLTTADGGPRTDAPPLAAEPGPTPVDDGAGFDPPKPPPSHRPPKAE